MNTGLFLSLSQKRIFWKIRAGLLRAHFMIEKWVYSVRLSIKEERSDIETFRQLLVISQKTFFVAAGLALICVFVDPYLYAFYQQIKTFVPGINTQNDSDYVTFLAVVSSITGIFIGLYYAGISAIGGAIYATVPSNVRNLLMYERGGNVYMSFLACLTFFCLILIALRLSGLPKLYTAIPFVTIFTGVGIIAFAKLGLRMFYFFDPTKLSGYLFEQLRQQLITVKAGGYRWQEDSFQHHAHRKSAEILDTLDTLSDLSARKTHLRGASFIQLAENLLGFLIRYEPEKRYIPTDSYWYEKRYQHRDWYQTEDSSVAIAHQTGRLLHPKVTTDKEWIERRIIPIIMKCIKANLLQKRYTDVNALFKFLNIYVEELTKEGSVKKALNFTEEISSIVMEQFIEKSKCRITKVEELEKLAVAEQLASLPTSIAVEYRKFLEKFDKQDIEQRLASIKWSKNKNIYYNGFPIYCLDRLEWFNPRLEFERKTEGKDISPLWYKTELVCQVEADQMSINTKALIETSAKFFKSLIEKALSYKHPWLAASIMSREWEYWHKVDAQIEIWGEKWSVISDDLRIDGLPWSQLDINTLRSDSKRRQHELLKMMSRQSVNTSLITRPDGYPDYRGQFLHASVEALFDALLNNNVNLFGSVFELYFRGCILLFTNLIPKGKPVDWRTQNNYKIASAALMNLMDLSGYAKLLSELSGNAEPWDIVVKTWKKHIINEPLKLGPSLLAAAIALTETPFELPHRGIIRTTWSQKINQKMASIPRKRKQNVRSSGGLLGTDTSIEHDSALVRVYAQIYGSHSDGIDIFIAYFLRSATDGNLDFGPKRQNLLDIVKREENIYQEKE